MKKRNLIERPLQDLIGSKAAKKRDGHWQKGFTLVEILVTIALIVIVAAIALPSYFGYSMNTNLKSAARNIQADFLDLKERAIAESTAYRITFDTGGNTYTIEKGTETGAPYTPIEVKALSSFGGDVGIFNAVFGGGIPTITFEGRGIATTGKVVLTNSRGSTATIAASVSGRTYVQVNNQ